MHRRKKGGKFKMDLMPTIDKYIMTSIKVNELEDLIVDTERQIVKTTVKRGIAYSNVQVKTMDSLDKNLSSYKKTREEAYKELNDAARVQDQTRRTYINASSDMSDDEVRSLIQALQEKFLTNEKRKEELVRRRNWSVIKSTEAKISGDEAEANRYVQISVSCFVEAKRIDDMQSHYIEVINNLNQVLNSSKKLELTSPRNN